MKYTNFVKKIFLSNIRCLKRPYKLTFAATYMCNSRCQICNIWQKKPKNELSLDEIKTFFTINNYFNWVDLTGGEVFLRPDFIQVCKVIIESLDNLILLHIPSNGLLPKKIENDVNEILKLNPYKLIITISLDGPQVTHNKLRGSDKSWSKAIKTFKKLRQIKYKSFKVYLGMTLSALNTGLIEKTYQELLKEISDLKRSEMHFNLAHISSHYYDNKNIKLGSASNAADEIDIFTNKKNSFGFFSPIFFLENQYQAKTHEYTKSKKCPLECQSGIASIFMGPNGDLFPCTTWNKKVANIRQIDFNLGSIWQSKKMQKMRSEIKKQKCPGCWTPCEAYQTILANTL